MRLCVIVVEAEHGVHIASQARSARSSNCSTFSNAIDGPHEDEPAQGQRHHRAQPPPSAPIGPDLRDRCQSAPPARSAPDKQESSNPSTGRLSYSSLATSQRERDSASGISGTNPELTTFYWLARCCCGWLEAVARTAGDGLRSGRALVGATRPVRRLERS